MLGNAVGCVDPEDPQGGRDSVVPTLSGGPPQEKEEYVEHMAVLSAFTRISLTNHFRIQNHPML